MSYLSIEKQKEILNQFEAKPFTKTLETYKQKTLKSFSLKVFQINVGKICNQACHHCHVDASPIRTESMNLQTAQKCVEIVKSLGDEVEIIDITGGAPEINPHFKYLVESFAALNKHIIDRCNLTILEEEGHENLHHFLKKHQVEIIASLPHYSASRTDQQRGNGIFDKSITALKKLNQLGYGKEKTLPLNLVYNPTGIFLSSSQQQLEREFKENLKAKHKIIFNHLYCINNMPISRFLLSLVKKNKFNQYMQTLKDAFNINTIPFLMCRNQVSIGYDGFIYDCDFNQMLEIKTKPIDHINHWDTEKIKVRQIALGNHCYGCTAGSGSSCSGEIT